MARRVTTNLNGGRLQESDLVLPRELQETRELLGEVHDLLHRHDGELGEVGEPLLTHFSVQQVLTLRPRLSDSHTSRERHADEMKYLNRTNQTN